jgi:D-aminopeptidase
MTATLPVKIDEAAIDAVFAHLDQSQLPGATVGIAVGGRPVYRKGFGLASIELPVVLTPSTRMRIGSTTKHFTCLTFLLLCEEGRAGLDDPVGRHLPELHAVARDVTMRQLMGNISGLIDPHDLCFQFSGLGPDVTSDQMVAYFQDISAVNAAPGTTWNYNNGGFELVRTVVERLTGQPLGEVMAERLFAPIGMADTVLRSCTYNDFLPNRATAHMVTKEGRFERWTWMEHIGSGGIVSTVDDMLRWLAHMDAPVVGTAQSWAALRTPQTLANGTSTGYGLGLTTSRYRGVEVLHHGGGGLGNNTWMAKVPAAGLDLVVMVNRGDVSGVTLANQILDACLPSLEPAAEPFRGPFATGTFRSPQTGRVVQLLERDGQQIIAIGGLGLPFAPDDAGVLRPLGGVPYQWAATLDGDPERPDAIRLDLYGNVEDLVRVPAAGLPDAAAIAGRYRSESTGSEVTIVVVDSAARMTTAGRFGSAGYHLEPLADGIWQASAPRAIIPPGGVLAFDADGRGFGYSTSQTWALPFRRVD